MILLYLVSWKLESLLITTIVNDLSFQSWSKGKKHLERCLLVYVKHYFYTKVYKLFCFWYEWVFCNKKGIHYCTVDTYQEYVRNTFRLLNRFSVHLPGLQRLVVLKCLLAGPCKQLILYCFYHSWVELKNLGLGGEAVVRAVSFQLEGHRFVYSPAVFCCNGCTFSSCVCGVSSGSLVFLT